VCFPIACRALKIPHSGGPVVDVLQKQVLSPEQVLKIFFAACAAVRHMHEQKPPITHRDIKVGEYPMDDRFL
jgi:serine/threonine protein kinase